MIASSFRSKFVTIARRSAENPPFAKVDVASNTCLPPKMHANKRTVWYYISSLARCQTISGPQVESECMQTEVAQPARSKSSERSSQTARATLRLREMILDGQFRPRERIKEIPLAAGAGASGPRRTAGDPADPRLRCPAILHDRYLRRHRTARRPGRRRGEA